MLKARWDTENNKTTKSCRCRWSKCNQQPTISKIRPVNLGLQHLQQEDSPQKRWSLATYTCKQIMKPKQRDTKPSLKTKNCLRGPKEILISWTWSLMHYELSWLNTRKRPNKSSRRCILTIRSINDIEITYFAREIYKKNKVIRLLNSNKIS